jgi:hypothetical protein
VTGLTGEIILEKMLDVVECAVACYQMLLREEQRDYQFVAVNHTFESLSGHDRSQLLAVVWAEIISADYSRALIWQHG